jgi:hypothetical protein
VNALSIFELIKGEHGGAFLAYFRGVVGTYSDSASPSGSRLSPINELFIGLTVLEPLNVKDILFVV